MGGYSVRDVSSADSRTDAGIDQFASILDSLVAVLTAGAPPTVAWQALAARFPGDPIVSAMSAPSAVSAVARAAGHRPIEPTTAERLVAAVRAEASTERRFARHALSSLVLGGWEEVAAQWLVVEACGSPAAAVTAGSAAAAVERVEAHRQVQRTLASARSTGRVLSLLPVVGLMLVSALGFDVWTALTHSVVVAFALLCAAALTGASALWRARMVAEATHQVDRGALFVRLVALAVESGVPVAEAAVVAAQAEAQATGRSETRVAQAPIARGVGRRRFWQQSAGLGDETVSGPVMTAPTKGVAVVDATVVLATEVGIPVGRLLWAEADRLRRASHADALRRASALEGRQLLPLGICDLPAFLCAGVVPAIVTLLGGW